MRNLREGAKGRSRLSGIASGVVMALIAGTVVALAFTSEGFPSTDVELTAGTVWVTDPGRHLAGTLNPKIGELTGAVKSKDDTFDVVQDGPASFLLSDTALTPIDGATMTLQDAVSIEAGTAVVANHGVVASADAAKGTLRITSTGSPSRLGSGAAVIDELGAGSPITVGTDGTVHAYSSKTHELVSYSVDSAGTVTDVTRTKIDGVHDGDHLELAAAGSTPVLLDKEGAHVITPSQTFDTGSATPDRIALQISAADDRIVYVADTQLVVQPVDGGQASVQQIDGAAGQPARPAIVAGCIHAAWQSGAYVRDCGNGIENLGPVRSEPPQTAAPEFRVNRNVIALNTLSGGLWVAKQNLKLVDNWNDVIPPDLPTDEHDEQSLRRSDAWTTPDRQQGNRPPVAQDDHFGARPGRTTLLSVLDNDSDPDGDVLTVKPIGSPAGVTVAQGGSALQIGLPPEATAPVTFDYEVSDGLGGTAQASVTVDVHGADVNEPPRNKRVPTLIVAQGKSVRYNALNDWIDPDGDSVVGAGATRTGSDEVDLLPNGLFTFTDGTNTPGIREVPITMTDGRTPTSGLIRIDVRPADQVLPVANADHVTVQAGQTAILKPLANDTDPSGDALRLAKVGETPDVRLTPDFPNGVISVTSDRVGSYYSSYVVTNGPNTAQGLIRIDVIDPVDEAAPPIAVNDVALLPSGKSTVVDVLANDSDYNDRVLVVQSIAVPPNAGINVSILEHRVLRISDSTGLAQPMSLRYTVSNGDASATGTVDIVPLTPPVVPRAPSAEADDAVVRVGDVVTIDVLDNDTHPDGDELHVAGQLVEPLPQQSGTMFVSQDRVRMKAGTTPGTYTAIYAVTDSRGQQDSAQITVHVLPRDDKTNSAPKPRAVQARTLSGSNVRITVPTDGIDADGDSVTLVGTSGSPAKGVVSAVGNGWIDYTALKDATGTDSFQYVVADRLGASARGRIDIGIAPLAAQNQLPTAADDRVSARPDRHLVIPVLGNDSDPDGDPLRLTDDAVGSESAAKKLDAKVLGSSIDVTTPSESGTYTFSYTVVDERGARGRATVTVTVAPDAPLEPPIVNDDFVSVGDLVADGKIRSKVDVPLLKNDTDPDGAITDASITTDDSGVSISDGTATIAVTDDSQVLLYTVTDQDDQTSSGFIHVPGRTSVGPTLRDSTPIEIPTGERREFDLGELVVVRPGHDPRITSDGKVTALHGDGQPLVVSATTLAFRCAKQYVGDAGLTFEVTDGKGPDDPEGKVSTLTVPIKCIASDNQPPTFTGTTLEVSQGDPATVDLASLAEDPDGDSLDFTLGTVPAGISAELSGTTLTVSVDDSAIGTEASIPVSVTDNKTPEVTASVLAKVTRSNRPLPVANPDDVNDAKAGQASTVNVLANDFNPFDDKPLTLLSATLQSGSGTATVSGSNVVITPASGFIGTLTVSYRIADATGDPARQATGTVTATVKDKPGAPGAPRVQQVSSGTVVLTWTAPSDNGSPITTYTVRGSSGFTQQCPQTTCSLTGLQNGTSYTFTVTATNEVGESDPSPASASATPDAKPDAPGAPQLTPGDKSLQVSWSAPNNSGTAITSYTLEISPAPASGSSQQTATSTSFTWTGLENGVPYRVRVQAHNSSPDPSEWSPYSASATPAGKPLTPSAPTAARSTSASNGGVIDVSWSPTDGNGSDITSYDVVILSGGSTQSTRSGLSGQSTTTQITGLSTAQEYQFAIVAHSAVGASAQSPPSASIRAFGLPGAISSVSATAGDKQATLSYSAPADNGGSISGYEVSLNGGGWQSFSGGSTGGTVTGLTNGTAYTFSVRAVNEAGSGPNGGTSNSVTPFGKPIAPSISGSASGKSVTFTWDSDTSHMQNGKSVTAIVKFDGTTVSNSGTYTGGDGYSQSHTLTIDVCDAGGNCSASQGQATSGAAPVRSILISNANFAAGTATLTWQGLAESGGVTSLRCWQQDKDAHANGWAAGGGFGQVISVSGMAESGSMTVNCGAPDPGNYFSIELYPQTWTQNQATR